MGPAILICSSSSPWAEIIFYGDWDAAGTKGGPLIDYYKEVESVAGGEREVRTFARLFLVPGMDHCGSGVRGPSDIDYLTYLENWAEKGQAPDVLVGRHVSKQESTPEYPRPIFAYPIEARYKGSGNATEASSFVPVDPRVGNGERRRQR
ncbi:MAG TPA: tannase/feruloyl esterase family alpha/beta hydrolase [Steroidobacter sp.]|uniref:tannase/feruloyl esterase family alpha/beta hydrolase n=1 Tax=Steroidobacter sp. TaxID=1978227 RepID=UPI002ED83C41